MGKKGRAYKMHGLSVDVSFVTTKQKNQTSSVTGVGFFCDKGMATGFCRDNIFCTTVG
jgi:hypothetical protein